MQSMMNLHANGVTYESVTARLSRRDTENPTIQRLTVPIGRVSLSCIVNYFYFEGHSS